MHSCTALFVFRDDDYLNVARSITDVTSEESHTIFERFCSFKDNTGKDCGLLAAHFEPFRQKSDRIMYKCLYMKTNFIRSNCKKNKTNWAAITFDRIYGTMLSDTCTTPFKCKQLFVSCRDKVPKSLIEQNQSALLDSNSVSE